MNKKHILYITYDGLTDFLGQSQVLPYIIGLEKEGYRFSILSYEKDQKFPSERKVVDDLIAGLDITWYPKKYHKRFSILATIWDVCIGISFLHKLKSRDRFDGVHCRSYISAMIGLYSKKTFQTKFIFDMRGFWADERIDGGLWNLKNPIFKIVFAFFKWIEKQCILHADFVVTLTEQSYLEMKKWKYVTDDINFKIIPCCVDLTIFSEDNISINKIEEIKTELNIKDKVVLSYLGSIGTWYMIDEMFEYFKVFTKKVPNAIFLFITPEPYSDIIRLAKKHDVDESIIRVVKAKRKEVPVYLSVTQFALFFIKPTYSKISSSPTKMAEIMAMGIPLICNSGVGDLERQVIQAKSGIVISSFTQQTFVDCVEEITHNSNVYFQKEISLNYVRNYFSLKHGVSLFNEIYKEVFYGKL
jgi:glycosyltransferase involved in cell wall biosynthesis